MIQYNPKLKASNDKPKISSSLPNVNMAMRFPVRMTPVSQRSDSEKSVRRKREPMISVPNRLMANQRAEMYRARTSIYRVPQEYLKLKFEFSLQTESKSFIVDETCGNSRRIKADEEQPANGDGCQPDDHRKNKHN